MAYVECNPVRARLVRKPWNWAWSSAAAHCGLAAAHSSLAAWPAKMDAETWRDNISATQDEGQIARLRLCTSRGRPLGSDSFLSKLELALGRRLRPLPAGRPKKTNDHKAEN